MTFRQESYLTGIAEAAETCVRLLDTGDTPDRALQRANWETIADLARAGLTRQPHTVHHPWGSVEQAIVLTLGEWKVECDMRPKFGDGSDCSDLMDTALTRIKGLITGALTPEDVIAEVES